MHNLVDIHTHPSKRQRNTDRLVCVPATEIGPRAESDRFCSGIHPHDTSSPSAETWFEAISTGARDGSLQAIGESGMDRSCRTSEIATQRSWFRRHIALSEASGLPLVIHSVRTDSDMLEEHSRARPRSPWILHACAANPANLSQFLSRGVHVSFGIRELSRPDARTRLKIALGPALFLETDDSTVPIQDVYTKAAEILGTSIEEIAAITHANWCRLFGS